MSTTSQWPLTPDAARQITPGYIRKHLQANPLTRACFPTAYGYYPRASGHSMQREEHNDNLMIYCAEGCGHIRSEHFSGTARQGDIILLPAGQPHQYQADADDPWTIYWVHFDGMQTRQLIEELAFDPENLIISIGQQPLLEGDFKRLLSLRQGSYRHTVFNYTFNYAAALTRQILQFLALQIRTSTQTRQPNFNLDQLQSLMLENIDGELDLDTLAASTKLSRHHFAAKYKKLTGISPIRHFNHLKMERACYLLDVSNESVKTVGARLGYSDPLYFSRIFKKVIGLAPSEYRMRLKG